LDYRITLWIDSLGIVYLLKMQKKPSLVSAYAELKGKEDLRSLMKKSKMERASTSAATPVNQPNKKPSPPPPSSTTTPKPVMKVGNFPNPLLASTPSTNSNARASMMKPKLAVSGAPQKDEKANEGNKRKSTGLVGYDNEGSDEEQAPEKKQKTAGNPIPEGFFDKPTQSTESNGSTENQEEAPKKGSLPKDFFDNPQAAKEANVPVEEEPKLEKGQLPEGFFDAKKSDKGGKNSDDLGEEWEKFQKEIQKETQISDQLKDEDIEEIMRERDGREILELEQYWMKVERLAQLREETEKKRLAELEKRNQAKGKKAAESSDDSDDDGDIDPNLAIDFLDWRAKGQM